ncbi:MAG: hypothetical protein QOG87_302 [Actinomycetota bacterium]|jgi:hypothetical protein
MLAGFLVAAASVVIAGGKLTRLGGLQFRGVPVLLAALLVQIVIISLVPEGNEGVKEAVHLASYLLVFGFLAANVRVPGLWLIAIGAFLNFAVIAANHGVMPADPAAMRRAGIERRAGEFQNSQPVDDARLAVLGDRFALPESWPVSNVFSVGDVLIVLGVTLGTHQICRSRIVPERFLPVMRNAETPTP